MAFPVASPSACCVCLAHPTPNGCVNKPRLFCFFQMSKSTGNFLTLSQAVDKFSADGEYVLTCRWVSVRPEGLTSVFCSRRSRGFVGVMNCNKSAAYHLFLFEKLNSVWNIGMCVSTTAVGTRSGSWCSALREGPVWFLRVGSRAGNAGRGRLMRAGCAPAVLPGCTCTRFSVCAWLPPAGAVPARHL